jgi:hypothetical protein
MEIELYSKLQNPIEAIDRIGEFFAKSGMFGCERMEQGKVLAMACLVEKKSPIAIAREYHIIEGKLSDRADSLMAKFLRDGGKRSAMESTPDKASITLTSKDGITMTFAETWEEIKAEPFVIMSDGKALKKNWRTPRARMQTLWARAISRGVRTLAPEIACGITITDEVDDEQPAPVTLNLAPDPKPAQATTCTTPSDSSDVIDVEVVHTATEPAAPAPTSPAPAPAPAPEPAPQPPAEPGNVVHPPEFRPGPSYTTPANSPMLSDNMVATLEAAIGPHAVAAGKWFLKEGWLQPGQGLAHLTEARANRILKQIATFLARVQGVQ